MLAGLMSRQHPVPMGVPEAAAHGQSDVEGPGERQILSARREAVEFLLEIGSLHQLHLEPHDGSAVEEAVGLYRVGRREPLGRPHLLSDALHHLRLKVDEDLEGDISGEVPGERPHHGGERASPRTVHPW